MTKQEFLEKLRLSLNGKVSAGVVTENLNYYENYINTEVRKGRREEEILSSLGDPRLIARTIVETNGGKTEQNSGFGGHGNGKGQEKGEYQGYGHMNGAVGSWLGKLPGWVWLILFIVVVVLVLSAIFRVIAFLAPVLIVIAAVMFLVKLFRDWIN